MKIASNRSFYLLNFSPQDYRSADQSSSDVL